MTSPRQITVRNPSAELVEALRAVAHERGESLNATILHLLGVALGVDERRRRLKRCASWTVEDLEEFDKGRGTVKKVSAV